LILLANFAEGKIFFLVNIYCKFDLNRKMPMKLGKIGEIWTNTLDFLGQAWWIEVSTTQPRCTYYFGPFADVKEAESAVKGHIEDLESESAKGIQAIVKRCKPERLTIDHDMGENRDRERATALSGQTSSSLL
jgi:hypothetical protein